MGPASTAWAWCGDNPVVQHASKSSAASPSECRIPDTLLACSVPPSIPDDEFRSMFRSPADKTVTACPYAPDPRCLDLRTVGKAHSLNIRQQLIIWALHNFSASPTARRYVFSLMSTRRRARCDRIKGGPQGVLSGRRRPKQLARTFFHGT